MPAEGIVHNLMIVSIRKSFRTRAKSDERDLVAWASDVYESDRGGGPRRECARLSRGGGKALCAIDPERDVQFTLGRWTRWIRSADAGFGSKMGIDATRKGPARILRAWPDEMLVDEKTKARVAAMWKNLGFERRSERRRT